MNIKTISRKLNRLYYYLTDTLYYKIKDFFWPHNVVKCRYLSNGWHDRDYLLLHSSFEILSQFIEKERPWWFTENWTNIQKVRLTEQFIGDEELTRLSREYADDVSKLKQLYYWWKFFGDGKNEYKIEKWYRKNKIEISYIYIDEDLYNAANQRLIQLVILRKYLWT